MDLSLYMLLAITGVWYLATCETDSKWPWILLAVSAMVCILGRATAPVYMAAMFGPAVVGRYLSSDADGRRWLLKHCVAAVTPVAALGGLYVWSKWDYLHYYYFVWGPDPMAHLPFLKALGHFQTAIGSAGGWILLAGLITCCAIVIPAAIRCRRWSEILSLLGRMDWKLLWLAAAPP